MISSYIIICWKIFFYSKILKRRRQRDRSLKIWFDNIKFNLKRLGRLILRGNPGKIFFPDELEGKNNLQRIVSFSKRMLNNTLKETLNKTTTEIVEIAKNVPKDLSRNLLCLTPNIILKVRQMQSNRDPTEMQRRFLKDIDLTRSKKPLTK